MVLEKVRIVNSQKVDEWNDPDARPPEILFQTLFVPELVEYSRGGNISQKIVRALSKSQLYVGIFGNQYSQPTVNEYHDATKRGMNRLVYYFTDPPSILKDKPSTDQVKEFLTSEVRTSDLLVRGNYETVLLTSMSDFENEVVVDLAEELTELIRRHTNVQKAVVGFDI